MEAKGGRRPALMLKKLPGAALEGAVRALEAPADLFSGMAHLELSGNREAVIDGCRGVLEYDENLIRLNAGKMTVRFTGRNLRLRNLKKDSAIVEGYIASVEFIG